MRVAFFADSLYYRLAAGTTRYAAELARHLSQRDDLDLRLFSLCPPRTIASMASERHYPCARSIGSWVPRSLQYLLWHASGWPGRQTAAVLDDVDVVHTPVLFVPPRRKCPLVVTVLDLTFRLFPQYHNRRTRVVAQSGLRRAVKDADALIAISGHTAGDLVRLCGVNPKRVHVVPLAADARFVPVRDTAATLARYHIDTPFVLYVGTLEPRKNLGLLLHAFAALGDPQVKLVLAGTKGWLCEDVFATVERLGLAGRVLFTGFVADEDLPALLSGARAFVYPSLYEGFGLPVLEAMQCGTPVITTNVSSLPEVAGDAALLVAPDDVAGLQQALRRVLSEPGLRDELRGKGLSQAARFSWQKTAEQTAQVYAAVR